MNILTPDNSAPQSLVITEMKNIRCPKCEHPVFTQVFVVKLIPGLLTGQTQDTAHPVALSKCDSCGHIEGLDQFVK